MSKEIAIVVDGVSKDFRLPHEKIDSVKSLFVNPFNKNRKKFEIQRALHDISFKIPKGEFFGIVGRNGSGKSTLLKIIAGIYQPNEGTVLTNGRLVPFIELGVGFNPELTGRENVYLNGALMGFSGKEIDGKYKAIVEFAELERFMDQRLKNYSSGMQVRLAFSTATLLADSDILLIDEVLAVGDADFQRKCFAYFKDLKRKGKTVVFVSHDMGAIREYCDRAVLIEKNEIVFSGTAEETAREYTRLFLPDVYSAQQNEENQKKHNEDKIRNKGKWGAGGISISKVTTEKSVFNQQKDKYIFISYTVTPDKEDYEDELMLGIAIKDGAGRVVCGTNSKIARFDKKIAITNKTKKITATWKVPNIFSEGEYSVEPAVDSVTRGELLEWWDDAIRFRVINEQNTPYVVSPAMSLTISLS